MPKVDKTKKPDKEHDYQNVISSLTLYNAVSYLSTLFN